MNIVIRGVLAAAFAGLCAGAQAQTSAPSHSARPAPGDTRVNARPGAHAEKFAAADLAFVQKVAAEGMAEVELGKLAQQKAQNEQVKQFGARMERDHAKANEELKKLASSKGLALPGGTERADKRDIDRLSQLSGEKFDREYMYHMVKDHKHDVKEFQQRAKGAKDADLRDFAARTLPTLEEHLKLAQATESAVHGGTGATPEPKPQR